MVWITLPNEYDDHETRWDNTDIAQLRMQGNTFTQKSFIDYLCALHVEFIPHKAWRATTIACNVGLSSNRTVDVLQRMMESGMNIARMNLASNHGDLDYHTQTVKNIRQAAKNYSKRLGVPFPVAIACNTIGPLVQTGYLESGIDTEVELKAGNSVKVTTDPAFKDKGGVQVIYIDYENVFDSITVGRVIWIDDGSIKLKVKMISGAFMTCEIEIGGMLGNRRTVNLPGTQVNLPALSERDTKILEFAISQDFDFIFCTFVRNAKTILEVRKELGEAGKHIKLIANIEDLQGLDNIDEIIKVADAIVVARGDLYLEVTIPKMFLAQKYIIAKCNRVGCPVFVSRELIESMMDEEIPAIADVGNVINVVIDGCNNLMLAREAHRNKYFCKVIKFVSHICKEAEAAVWRSKDYTEWSLNDGDLLQTIALAAVDSSIKLWAAAILVITEDGNTAKVVSKYRPRCPIVAITRDARVARQLHVYRSVIPFQYTGHFKSNERKDIEAQIGAAIEFGKNRKFIEANDPIVVVYSGKINTMRIHYVPEKLELIDNVLCIS